MRPPAQVWCVPCQRKGHKCQAQMYDAGGRPTCLPCENAEACAFERVGPPPTYEEWCAADAEPAPVIQRTAAELGMPEVVPGKPEPKREWIEPYERAVKAQVARAQAAKLHAAVEARKNGRGRKVANHKWIRSEEEQQIIDAIRAGMSEAALMQRFDVSKGTIWRIRKKAGLLTVTRDKAPAMQPPLAVAVINTPSVQAAICSGASVTEAIRKESTEPPKEETPVEACENSRAHAPAQPQPEEPAGFECVTLRFHLALTDDKADSIWKGFTLGEKAKAIERALQERWLTA